MSAKRRIIQIAVEGENTETSTVLYALCDDGSLWWSLPHTSDNRWQEIRPIPTIANRPSESIEGED